MKHTVDVAYEEIFSPDVKSESLDSAKQKVLEMLDMDAGVSLLDQRLTMIAVQGVKLDDYEVNTDRDLSYGWTQICESCRSKFPEYGVDHNSGHGICGVFGCENDSNHYLDFDKSELHLTNPLPKRVFNSPLIECVNFEDGSFVNLIKLTKPYADGRAYAVYETTKSPFCSNGMFKSYELAKEKFELMVRNNEYLTIASERYIRQS